MVRKSAVIAGWCDSLHAHHVLPRSAASTFVTRGRSSITTAQLVDAVRTRVDISICVAILKGAIKAACLPIISRSSNSARQPPPEKHAYDTHSTSVAPRLATRVDPAKKASDAASAATSQASNAGIRGYACPGRSFVLTKEIAEEREQ